MAQGFDAFTRQTIKRKNPKRPEAVAESEKEMLEDGGFSRGIFGTGRCGGGGKKKKDPGPPHPIFFFKLGSHQKGNHDEKKLEAFLMSLWFSLVCAINAGLEVTGKFAFNLHCRPI